MLTLSFFLAFVALTQAFHVYYGPPKDATIRERPFQAALFKDDIYLCSATIISKKCAVTACSCVVDEDMQLEETKSLHNNYTLATYTRYLNIEHTSWQSVSAAFIAGGCDVTTQENDAAVLCSSNDLLGYPAKVVKERTNENVRGIVSGWGLSVAGEDPIHDGLRRTYMRIISLDECRQRYTDVREVPESALCAIATPEVLGFCSGDYGGPLTHGEGLIGIAVTTFGCDDRKYPGIFTNTSMLSDFFENVVAEFESHAVVEK